MALMVVEGGEGLTLTLILIFSYMYIKRNSALR